MSSSSNRKGPPKHQNKFAWKPKAGQTINPTEVGGRLRPFSEVTGVCSRCKEQIDWKRKYGKYKPLAEPAKCQRCSKRNVRQAYHNLCTGCAKEQSVCAKCSCRVDHIIGRDISEVEAEQKTLEEAIKNARERDRRSLLRAVRYNTQLTRRLFLWSPKAKFTARLEPKALSWILSQNGETKRWREKKPSMPCWGNSASWDALDRDLGGRLVAIKEKLHEK